jgi:hypothetical protein
MNDLLIAVVAADADLVASVGEQLAALLPDATIEVATDAEALTETHRYDLLVAMADTPSEAGLLAAYGRQRLLHETRGLFLLLQHGVDAAWDDRDIRHCLSEGADLVMGSGWTTVSAGHLALSLLLRVRRRPSGRRSGRLPSLATNSVQAAVSLVPVCDLLQVLGRQRATGRLTIADADGVRLGSIDLLAGRVRDVDALGSAPPLVALGRLVTLVHQGLQLHFGAHGGPVHARLDLTVEMALLDGMRAYDDLHSGVSGGGATPPVDVALNSLQRLDGAWSLRSATVADLGVGGADDAVLGIWCLVTPAQRARLLEPLAAQQPLPAGPVLVADWVAAPGRLRVVLATADVAPDEALLGHYGVLVHGVDADDPPWVAALRQAVRGLVPQAVVGFGGGRLRPIHDALHRRWPETVVHRIEGQLPRDLRILLVTCLRSLRDRVDAAA